MNDLKWVKVKSSNLSKVAYDKADKELYVEFKSGSKYSYIDVSNKKFKIKPNHDYRYWN